MNNKNLELEVTCSNRIHAFQNENKTKWTDELIIAYRELVSQNEEKEKRVAEFIKVTSGNGI
ncbi:MAG: hypothetical protein Q8N05_15820 [Bacteroidota bacterium]|nr:hypothetical protein [Bacteroidota bacterium]